MAFTAEVQTKLGIVGSILFPTAFVIIILLRLELVTRSFALISLAVMEKRASKGQMLQKLVLGDNLTSNWRSSLCLPIILTITQLGQVTDHGMIMKIEAVAEAKTLGYKSLGSLIVVFVKSMVCIGRLRLMRHGNDRNDASNKDVINNSLFMAFFFCVFKYLNPFHHISCCSANTEI